jgi:hypothetical protein
MKRVCRFLCLPLALSLQLSALDFTFGANLGTSSETSSQLRLGMSMGDYQSRKKDGLWLGWNLGVETIANREATHYYTGDGVVSIPGDNDFIFGAEGRLLYRTGGVNEFYLGAGGAYDYLNSDTRGSGPMATIGYNRVLGKETFWGVAGRYIRMEIDTTDPELIAADGMILDIYMTSIYFGFRF